MPELLFSPAAATVRRQPQRHRADDLLSLGCQLALEHHGPDAPSYLPIEQAEFRVDSRATMAAQACFSFRP